MGLKWMMQTAIMDGDGRATEKSGSAMKMDYTDGLVNHICIIIKTFYVFIGDKGDDM